MKTLTFETTLDNWSPDTVALAEELLIGPQAEVLQLVNSFNERYNSNIGITKTFRWSPGFTKERKRLITEFCYHLDRGGKNSTFFNRFENNRWMFRNIRSSLTRIDDMLATLKREHIIFSDNTELIESLINFLITKIQSEIVKTREVFGEAVEINAYLADLYCDDDEHRQQNYASGRYIVLLFKFNDYNLNYYVSRQSDDPISIPMGETIVSARIPLKYWLNRLCRNLTNDNINDPNDELFTYKLNHLTEARTVLEGYHNHHQLTHPFIRAFHNNDRYNGAINYDLGEEITTFFSTCHGSFDDIQRLLFSSKILEATQSIINWMTIYTEGRTNPSNNIRYSYYGYFPQEGMIALNNDNFRCIKNVDKSYCQKINCLLIDTCISNATHDIELSTSDLMDLIDCSDKDTIQSYFQGTKDELIKYIVSTLEILSYTNERFITELDAHLAQYKTRSGILDVFYFVYRALYLQQPFRGIIAYFIEMIYGVDMIYSFHTRYVLNLVDTEYRTDSLDDLYSKIDELFNDDRTSMERNVEVNELAADTQDPNQVDNREADMMNWLRNRGISNANVEVSEQHDEMLRDAAEVMVDAARDLIETPETPRTEEFENPF